jgi:DNA-binding transcriptional regulator YiaG
VTAPEIPSAPGCLTTVAAVREASGVSQKTMAKAVGVPLSRLCAWEDGTGVPEGPEAEAYYRIIADLAGQQEAGRG